MYFAYHSILIHASPMTSYDYFLGWYEKLINFDLELRNSKPNYNSIFLVLLALSQLITSACDSFEIDSGLQNRTDHQIPVWAHRGYFKHYDENTMGAFRAAMNARSYGRSNIQGVELDVQLTRDAKLVVLHDTTLRRTAQAYNVELDSNILDKQISDLEWNEIKNVVVGRDGEKLSLLKDVLRTMNSEFPQISFLVELKSFKQVADGEGAEAAKKVVESVKEVFGDLPIQLKENVNFISFDENILNQLDGQLTNNSKFWIFEESQIAGLSRQDLEIKMNQAIRSGFDWIDLEMGDYLRQSPVIEIAHKYGLKVASWPNNGKRTDGRVYYDLALEKKLDGWTSDLWAGWVIADQQETRLQQTINFFELRGISPPSDLKAFFYAPVQTDFARGSDVVGDIEPTSELLKKAVSIDLERLANELPYVVVNLSDAGNLVPQLELLIGELAREKGLNVVVLRPKNGVENLNSIASISQNLNQKFDSSQMILKKFISNCF